MNFCLRLVFIIIWSTNLPSAQVQLFKPMQEVHTFSEGQVGIEGRSNIGTHIITPPTDPKSIGVVGLGHTGVKGQGYSDGGNGVHGIANRRFGRGVYGTSSGDNAYGVRGEATGGGSTGVYGVYQGTSTGSGVQGLGIGANVRGVFGVCTNSSTGYGGYFIGGYGTYISPRLGVQRYQPQYPIHVGSHSLNGNGAHVTWGGTWTNASSRSFKEDFHKVDPQEILTKLANLEITRWSYKASKEGHHLGPVAEDFYDAFLLGHDQKYISTVDADGVAFAAIQALYMRLIDLEQSNRVLREALLNLK